MLVNALTEICFSVTVVAHILHSAQEVGKQLDETMIKLALSRWRQVGLSVTW